MYPLYYINYYVTNYIEKYAIILKKQEKFLTLRLSDLAPPTSIQLKKKKNLI